MFSSLLNNIRQNHNTNFHPGLKIYYPNRLQDQSENQQDQESIKKQREKIFIENAVSLENQFGPLLQSETYSKQQSALSQGLLLNKFRFQEKKTIFETDGSINPFVMFQIRKEISQLKQICNDLSNTMVCQVILWQRLKEQISIEIQHYIKQFIQKIQQKSLEVLGNSQGTSCSRCMLLQKQKEALKKQVKESVEAFQKVKLQDESLNQKLFDLEQKLIGIDIQVQKRANNHNKQLIQMLQQQLYTFQQKCFKLESYAYKQSDLKERQRNIIEMEANIKQSLQHLQRIKGYSSARAKDQKQQMSDLEVDLAEKSKATYRRYSEVNESQPKSLNKRLVIESRLKSSPSQQFNTISSLYHQHHSKSKNPQPHLQSRSKKSPHPHPHHHPHHQSYIIQNRKPVSPYKSLIAKTPLYSKSRKGVNRFKESSQLGVKLQRLRNQIKKQMQSIK